MSVIKTNLRNRISKFLTRALLFASFILESKRLHSQSGFRILRETALSLNEFGSKLNSTEARFKELQNFSLEHTGDISDFRNRCSRHWSYRKLYLEEGLIVGDDFTRYIGHLGWGLATRIYYEMTHEQTLPRTAVFYSRTCNSHLLESYFTKYFPITKLPTPAYNLVKNLEAIRFEQPAYIYTNAGAIETTDAQAQFAKYVYKFEKDTERKFPGIFSLEEEDLNFKCELLHKLGLEVDQEYVVVHLKGINRSSRRGVDSKSYIPSIKYLLETGRSIFYLGEGEELPQFFLQEKNFIDLRTLQERTPRVDLILLAGCLFGLVTTSGPNTIPGLFGRPTLWTNSVGLPRYVFFPQCTFIPKVFQVNGKVLSVSQMLMEPQTYFVDNFDYNNGSSVVTIDNSSEDILNSIQTLEKTKFFPNYNAETAKLEGLIGRGTSVLDSEFIKKFPYWIS
jgi:putative glycosyltransferase (TIGR04372 family)